ncbi:MAG: hypothetical protein K8R48_04665 [Alphaproteobacteria bacterium]|nr:hypothetical protein [Alphaproteobacteria bacterium]
MSLLSITQAKGRALVELTLLVIDLGFRGSYNGESGFFARFFCIFFITEADSAQFFCGGSGKLSYYLT